MDHWTFVEDNYQDLLRLGRRKCRGRLDLVDEMVHDIICERLPQIFENWDPTMGVPADKKAWIDISWYMFKWMNRRMRTEVIGHEQLTFEEDLQDHRENNLLDTEEVEVILSRLHPYDAGLLAMHLLSGMTFFEIGDALDVSKGTAHKHYLKAIKHAQEVCNVDSLS